MSAPMVRLDGGLMVPLDKCDWVFFHPCGCPRGVMMAAVGGTAVYSEDAAWIEFFDNGYGDARALADEARSKGVTAKLMSHAQYKTDVYPAMTAPCPHEPVQLAIDIEAVDVR